MQRFTSFILALIIGGSAIISAIFVVQAIRDEQTSDVAVSTGEESQNVQDSTDSQETNQTQEINENMLQGKPLANFTATTARVDDVKIEDLTVGTGAEVVSATQTVTAHYTGARAEDGIVFESSKDSGQTFSAPLNNLIAGWQTGMIGMKVGGVRRLTIPAAQAYGDDASSGRPTGDLVFDIELFDVK